MIGYRCIACNAAQGADYGGFACPACGGNLDIRYDYETIGKEIAQGFISGDDVFRYSPLLPVTRPAGGFPLKIGGTPLYRATRLGEQIGLSNLWIKDDTGNPSASFKDRPSAIALQRAIDIGANTVAVASTGNAGSSTACIAAALGLNAIVFVPESAPSAKLAQSLAYGATVLAVRGTYDDAYDLCLKASREFGWFNRSTGFNPFTREGKKTATYEIWEQLGRVPERVIVPTGDGNILSGIWKGWTDLRAVGLIDRLPKIDCAQSDASAAISHAVTRIREDDREPNWSTCRIDAVDASTVADSISVDQPRDGLAAVKAVVQSSGEAVTVTDAEILAAIPEIAAATGVFAEPAAACSIAAARRMVVDERIQSDELTVCLVTGNGLKDVGNVARALGQPLVIDPSLEAVQEAVETA